MKSNEFTAISMTVLAFLCVVFIVIGMFQLVKRAGIMNVENIDSNSSGLEIEKKWLINEEDIPYDLSKADEFEIFQTYINYSPEIRVRKIIYKNAKPYYTMTIKRYVNDDALTREEINLDITEEEYN